MLSLRRVMNSSISTWVLTHFISGTGSSGLLFTLGWYGQTCPFLGTPHLPHLYDPLPLSSSVPIVPIVPMEDSAPGVGWEPGRLACDPIGAVEAELEVRTEAVEREECKPGWWDCGGGGPRACWGYLEGG